MEPIAERDVEATRIAVVVGDITRADVDAIVNAANAQLSHGGGVAAAIAAAGAPVVQQESTDWVREHGSVRAGAAVVTGAGPMPAGHVIHVVGPVYAEGRENARLLTTAVSAALEAAEARQIASLALPAISAGIFGYPLADAAAVIAATVVDWARTHEWPREVLLVGFDEAAGEAFAEGLRGAH